MSNIFLFFYILNFFMNTYQILGNGFPEELEKHLQTCGFQKEPNVASLPTVMFIGASYLKDNANLINVTKTWRGVGLKIIAASWSDAYLNEVSSFVDATIDKKKLSSLDGVRNTLGLAGFHV